MRPFGLLERFAGCAAICKVVKCLTSLAASGPDATLARVPEPDRFPLDLIYPVEASKKPLGYGLSPQKHFLTARYNIERKKRPTRANPEDEFLKVGGERNSLSLHQHHMHPSAAVAPVYPPCFDFQSNRDHSCKDSERRQTKVDQSIVVTIPSRLVDPLAVH